MPNRGASPAHNLCALDRYRKLANAVLNGISATPKKTIQNRRERQVPARLHRAHPAGQHRPQTYRR